jgi:hypothetical protein
VRLNIDIILVRLLLWALSHGNRWRKAKITYTLARHEGELLVTLNFIDKHGNNVTMEASGGPVGIGHAIIGAEASM